MKDGERFRYTGKQSTFDLDQFELTAGQKLMVKSYLVIFGQVFLFKNDRDEWEVISPLEFQMEMFTDRDQNITRKELIYRANIDSNKDLPKGYTCSEFIVDEMIKLPDDVIEKSIEIYNNLMNKSSGYSISATTPSSGKGYTPIPNCKDYNMSSFPHPICDGCFYHIDNLCLYVPDNGAATSE